MLAVIERRSRRAAVPVEALTTGSELASKEWRQAFERRGRRRRAGSRALAGGSRQPRVRDPRPHLRDTRGVRLGGVGDRTCARRGRRGGEPSRLALHPAPAARDPGGPGGRVALARRAGRARDEPRLRHALAADGRALGPASRVRSGARRRARGERPAAAAGGVGHGRVEQSRRPLARDLASRTRSSGRPAGAPSRALPSRSVSWQQASSGYWLYRSGVWSARGRSLGVAGVARRVRRCRRRRRRRDRRSVGLGDGGGGDRTDPATPRVRWRRQSRATTSPSTTASPRRSRHFA